MGITATTEPEDEQDSDLPLSGSLGWNPHYRQEGWTPWTRAGGMPPMMNDTDGDMMPGMMNDTEIDMILGMMNETDGGALPGMMDSGDEDRDGWGYQREGWIG